jgi:hypothetical protein
LVLTVFSCGAGFSPTTPSNLDFLGKRLGTAVEKKTMDGLPRGSGRSRAGGYMPAMGLTLKMREGFCAAKIVMTQSWVRSAALSTPGFGRI